MSTPQPAHVSGLEPGRPPAAADHRDRRRVDDRNRRRRDLPRLVPAEARSARSRGWSAPARSGSAGDERDPPRPATPVRLEALFSGRAVGAARVRRHRRDHRVCVRLRPHTRGSTRRHDADARAVHAERAGADCLHGRPVRSGAEPPSNESSGSPAVPQASGVRRRWRFRRTAPASSSPIETRPRWSRSPRRQLSRSNRSISPGATR